jgi:hypothetical protein
MIFSYFSGKGLHADLLFGAGVKKSMLLADFSIR